MKNEEQFEQLKLEWHRINQLNPKEKYKKLKELSFKLQISEYMSLEEINLHTKIIESARKISGFPSHFNKKLQLLTLQRIKQLGIDLSLLKNILKKNIEITAETATIGIADWQYAQSTQEDNAARIEQQMEKGERLFFSTGYDGTFKVQVRLVNLEFPVFTAREYSKLIDFSDLFILNVPTGTLAITDYLFNEPAVKIEVPPGQYRVCFNLNDKDTYIICLAKLTSEISLVENNVSIPQLEG